MNAALSCRIRSWSLSASCFFRRGVIIKVMLIIWDYYGVIAQDAFWNFSNGTAMAVEGRLDELRHQADLGAVSWDDYCQEVAKRTGLPLGEVMSLYDRHNVNKTIIRLIRSLQGAHKQVLLSNASGDHLLKVMAGLGLVELFDDIYVSSRLGYAKPDPRAYRQVLDDTGVNSADAVMIDDTPIHVEAARRLGMQGLVHISSEETCRGLLEIIERA